MFSAQKIRVWVIVGFLFLPVWSRAADPVKWRCELFEEKEAQLTHARAKDELGALFCLGFLHGRDRAWQVDHLRRIALGQRAEVYGSDWVRSDFGMRLLGFAERAESLYLGFSKDDQDRFKAYARGVNAGWDVALTRGVYEFKRYGYVPPEWKPWHSVALLFLQAFDQTKKNYEIQSDEKDRTERFGASAEKLFSEKGLPWSVSILKSGEYPLGEPSQTFAQFGSGGNGAGEGQGSNNWVLAPSRSKSGRAWLANDPHLTLKHPPFWYFTHIEGGGLNVIGASIPGLPVIPSGSNEKVSWGLTNSYLDVAEIAQVPNEELKSAAAVYRPMIWVKMGPVRLPFFFKTFERTRKGLPVMPLDSDPGTRLVLYWSGFDLKPEDFKGFFNIMKAEKATHMDSALARFRLPSWNYVFSDHEGRVGYRAVGRVPRLLRPKTYGVGTQPLAEVEKEKPTLTDIEMPHVLNPPRGYVVTANNMQWPSDGKYFIGRAQSAGFRALRIEELIEKTKQHDLESLKKIQCDTQAVDARFFVPRLLAAAAKAEKRLSPWQKRAIALLAAWDFDANEDCEACAVYRRWMDHLLEGINENALFRLLGIGGEMENTVLAGLELALKDLGVEKRGGFPKWKEIHRATFPHLLSKKEFRASSLGTPGDKQSVNPGTSDWEGDYWDHHSGASQRLLVEMSSPPSVYFVLAGMNLDRESRDPAQGADYKKWKTCEIKKAQFPLDWSKIRLTDVVER